MELDCMPAGMELFPAADEEQFEFIKKIINDCDYYILIIGGRYGSVTETGISYTEKEYDYAITRGLKVLAFVHEEPDSIPLGKSEKDPVMRERLAQFKEKVITNRLVKMWKSADQLPGLVSLSLSKTIKTYPAVGWVRGNRTASEEILAEINGLRKINERLQGEIALQGPIRPEIQDLAGLEDEVTFHGNCNQIRFPHDQSRWMTKTNWRQVFGLIAPYLDRHPSDDYVNTVLTEGLFEQSGSTGYYRHPKLDDQEFRTVAVQLKALALVTIEYSPTVSGSMGLFWSLTRDGDNLMMEIRTVKKGSRTKSSS